MGILNDMYPSKFLKAPDLDGPTRLTISDWEQGTVGEGDKQRPQLVLSFSNHAKQWGLNKTNAYIIAGVYGDDPPDWIGEEIVVFPTVGKDPHGRVCDTIVVDERRTKGIVQQKLKAAKGGSTPAPPPPPPREAGSDDEGPADDDIPF